MFTQTTTYADSRRSGNTSWIHKWRKGNVSHRFKISYGRRYRSHTCLRLRFGKAEQQWTYLWWTEKTLCLLSRLSQTSVAQFVFRLFTKLSLPLCSTAFLKLTISLSLFIVSVSVSRSYNVLSTRIKRARCKHSRAGRGNIFLRRIILYILFFNFLRVRISFELLLYSLLRSNVFLCRNYILCALLPL
jgi:hypothetical protein